MPNHYLQDLSVLFYKPCYLIFNHLRHMEKKHKGPKFKHSLIDRILLTLFKLKYQLPDRVLETLFHIDHVTISRYISRISRCIAALNIKLNRPSYYIVDTTTIRIGKDKGLKTFSGYKHHHGLKYQCLINDNKDIVSISSGIASSIHDKKIFETEYFKTFNNLNTKLKVLGDKAYVGLAKYHVETPFKHNERRFKINKHKVTLENKALSTKRIQVEHVFAWLKNYKILINPYHYTKQKIDIFVKAVCNIYNIIKNYR